MSTKEEARSLASEVINDLKKQLILMDDRIESLYNEYPESMRFLRLYSMQRWKK